MSLEPKPITEVMSEEDIVAAIEAAMINKRTGEILMWARETAECNRSDLYDIAVRRAQRARYMVPNE